MIALGYYADISNQHFTEGTTMNTLWKRLILTIALPVAMAVGAPAQADFWFTVDDFDTNRSIGCLDGAADTCPETDIDGGTVWNYGGPDYADEGITRTLDAMLLSGDSVQIEVCDDCQTAHIIADAGVPPSVGDYWFEWTGPSVNLVDGVLEFDWSADLAGTTWFADINDVDTDVQAALPGGFTSTTASINLSDFFDETTLSDVNQISLHFNGVAGLDANIDNVEVHAVPEPSILALLSVSLLGLGWVRRRRVG
jgi:hypothetical protein